MEVVDVTNTRLPVVVVGALTVAVRVGDTEPYDGERRPTEDERCAEKRHVVLPSHVNERREDVDQVTTTTFGDILTGDVARPILVYYSPRLTLGEASSAINQRLEDTPVMHRLITATSLIAHLL